MTTTPTDTPATPTARLARISLTKLRAHPRNVRMDLGDLSELAESIRADGLHQPIEVQSLGGGYFGIIDGHRRFGACVLAGLRAADVLIVPARTTAQIVTTMLTTGVHAKPLTLAERQRALRILLDEERLPVSQVAAQLGVTAATIRRWRDGNAAAVRTTPLESTAESSAATPQPTEPSGRIPRYRQSKTVSARKVTMLADEWAERVGEHGLAADDVHQLLAELRALTAARTESR